MAQVEQIFKSMSPDDDIFEDVVAYSRQACEAEKVFHKRQIQELQRESEGIQSKLDKLMDLLLDGALSKEEHDQKRQRFKARQIELANQLNSYHMADDGFRDAVADTLELGRKAHDLFLRSNNAGKRRLLGFVFSNLQLSGQKVQYSLRKPFDLYVKAGNIGEWRAQQDLNLQPLA